MTDLAGIVAAVFFCVLAALWFDWYDDHKQRRNARREIRRVIQELKNWSNNGG